MTITAKNFKGFNTGELMVYLKKIPKKTRIVLNMDGEETPLNVLQDPISTNAKNTIMFNSLYEDEFK